MAVVAPEGTYHDQVRSLPEFLRPGDLVVVNTSATLPAAVDVDRQGCTWPLHVSTQLDDGSWVVELRLPDNSGPAEPTAGEVLRLPGGMRLRVAAAYPPTQRRLWRVTPLPALDRVAYLAVHGRPIRYPYLTGDWPLGRLAERVRRPAGQRRDGQRRPAAHQRPARAADGARHPRGPGGAAHRRVQPGGPRAAAARGVHRPGGHRAPGQRHRRRGSSRGRGRHHRRPRARVGRAVRARGPDDRLDRPRPRPSIGRPGSCPAC